MKINFLFSKAAFCTIMENCWHAVRGQVSHNVSGDPMTQRVAPVYGRGMYGLLVMSGHEQDPRR